MFHRIKSVTALENFILFIRFEDGTVKKYDVKPLFHKFKPFEELKNNIELFNQVKIDVKGYGISWNDDIDLSCNELWENGAQFDPFDGLLSTKQATDIWQLNESSLRKAIEYGKLVVGSDVKKFGKQWIVTYDAMKREYGSPNKKVED